MLKVVAILAVTTLCGLQSTHVHSQCGDLVNGNFGPFDYRTAPKATKDIVESAHFTTDVETLRAGSSNVNIAGDLAYTLGVFPNHPRALLAISNLGLRQKVTKPTGAKWTVDCYFDRAIRWQPDDQLVRLVYGIHLINRGQKDAARAQLAIAEQNQLDQASFQYNLGLAFLNVDDTERALAHAWRAYALGYELLGLRRRLEKLGKWRDPEQ